MMRGEYANATDFLNKLELGMIESNPNNDLTKNIIRRGTMFSDIHNTWIYYDYKINEQIILNQGEWEINVRSMLITDYGLDDEEINRTLGQYFQKLREGIK